MTKNTKAISIGVVSFVIFEGLNYLKDSTHFQHENVLPLTALSLLLLFLGMGYFITYYFDKSTKNTSNE